MSKRSEARLVESEGNKAGEAEFGSSALPSGPILSPFSRDRITAE